MLLGIAAGMVQDEASTAKRALQGAAEAANHAATAMFMIPGPAGLWVGALLGATTGIQKVWRAFNDIGPAFKKMQEAAREKRTKR